MSSEQFKTNSIPVSYGRDVGFMAASHEDASRPGALKKVLFDSSVLPSGKFQMLNWAKIPAGKAFQNHYHEDMSEVFVITSGKAEMIVAEASFILEKGDSIIIPPKTPHRMSALNNQDVDYLVFGVSSGENGKTIVLP